MRMEMGICAREKERGKYIHNKNKNNSMQTGDENRSLESFLHTVSLYVLKPIIIIRHVAIGCCCCFRHCCCCWSMSLYMCT